MVVGSDGVKASNDERTPPSNAKWGWDKLLIAQGGVLPPFLASQLSDQLEHRSKQAILLKQM